MVEDRSAPKSREDAASRRLSSPLSPFRNRLFATIWVAEVVANIGTWMYGAAAGWLMTGLDPDPLMVSLVQTASNLPLLLFAIPAGALADVVDLRRLIIGLEIATTVVAAIFAALVSLNLVNPAILLLFVFLIGALAAVEAPAWQSVVPHLVTREDLAPAIAANSVGINVSRAIGPALGGGLIAVFGISIPFWLNAISNGGVILAFLRWRAGPQLTRNLPAERFAGALALGFRYTRYNRYLQAPLWRAVGFLLFASAYWALLPNLARFQVSGGAELYGLMLGAIGLGAIGGSFFLPRLNVRLGADRVVEWSTAATALALVMLGLARAPVMALAACALAGVAWIAVLTNLNVSAQAALPDWVRGRGLAMYVTVLFGTITLGSVIWGEVARLSGLPLAHFAAAAGSVLAIPLMRRWKLHIPADMDLSPSMHWPPPVLAGVVGDDAGPVLVSVDYRVAPENREAFLRALYVFGRERKRDGAYAWDVFMDTANEERFIETFLVDSWLEHLRQHERVTKADRLVEQEVLKLARGQPVTTHAIHVEPAAPTPAPAASNEP
jgi:predicted MFS family arabinose efflux permease